MTDYKTILTALGNKEIDKNVLNTAFHIAKNFNSHIHMVNVKPDPVINFPYYGDGIATSIIPEMITVTEKIALEKSKNSIKTFNDFCLKNDITKIDLSDLNFNQKGLSASYCEKTGIENEIMADLAKIFALTIYACPRENKAYPSLLGLDAILIDGGASAVVVPEKPIAAIGKRIAVAWNGTVTSARALKAAKPFLRKADEILLIAPEKEFEVSVSLEELLKTLEFENICPKVELIADSFSSSGSIILTKAAAFNADLLVMGAYTNSAIRRLILGGITKYVLFNTTIPLFLSH